MNSRDFKDFGQLLTKANEQQLHFMLNTIEIEIANREIQTSGWIVATCRGCDVVEYVRFMEFVTAFNRVEKVCRTCAEHFRNLQEVEYQ